MQKHDRSSKSDEAMEVKGLITFSTTMPLC